MGILFFRRDKPLFFSALLGGMALTSSVAFCATPEEVSAALKKIPSAPIASTFGEKTTMLGDAPVDVEMDPARVPMIALNGRKLLAVPLQLSKQGGRTLHIRSYVTQAPEGKYTMYYPIVSLVNDRLEPYKTLKPKVDFNFNGKTLTNEFTLPDGAERLLIHTGEEYFNSDFSAETYIGDPGADPMKPNYFPRILFGGGLLGSLINTIIDGANNEFTFSEVGVISISRP